MKKKRALVYIRVSTEKQAQTGVSLETQRERCLEFALEAGYTVGKKDFFVDAGESARTLARPALVELMDRAKTDSQISAVVVYDISRLARNRLDFALIKQVLRKEGVSLLSATEPIDETPEGQMLEGVLSTVAEFFSAQSGRKVKVNMEKKARDGGWPALAPYGYRNRKEKLSSGQVRAWIEPHPDEAPWVKRAFKEFATGGWSVKELAAKLEDDGIHVRQAKNRTTRRFHNSQLDRLLRNRIYIGLIDWGEVKGARGTHRPLVPASRFYSVQDHLNQRAGSVPRKVRYYSPLKPFSVCASCGSTMTLDHTDTSARTIRYFRCRKMKSGQVVSCGESYFEEDAYLEEAGKLLHQVELPPELVKKTLTKIETDLQEEHADTLRRTKEVKTKLRQVRERKKKLVLRELEDTSDSDLYREIGEDLDREEAELQEKLDRGQEVQDREVAVVLQKAAEILGAGGRAFEAVDNSEVRGLLLQAIFAKLELAGGKVRRAELHPFYKYFEIPTRNVQIPLTFPVEALLCGAPPGNLVEAGTSCRNWQLPLHIGALVERCHAELEKRALL